MNFTSGGILIVLQEEHPLTRGAGGVTLSYLTPTRQFSYCRKLKHNRSLIQEWEEPVRWH